MNKEKRVTFRIEEKLLSYIEDMAACNGISVGQYIRNLIQDDYDWSVGIEKESIITDK